MAINKEGYPFISATAGATAAAAGLAAGLCSPWLAAIAAIGAVKTAFFCYFFRDPERKTPDGASNVLLSPADGKVMEIADEDGGAKTIRIFLSVFNVHIQRSPAAGTVQSVVRTGTKYLPAMKSAAHGENVRNVITIETPDGATLTVHQIVGILARRLVLWIKPGDVLAAGRRIGMIKLGSQVDLTFPSGFEPLVKPGDRVVGGVTPVARKS